MKTTIIRICDKLIELCFYILLVAVTFSTSIVEIASTTMIVVWVIKKLADRDLKAADSVPVRILLAYFVWVILSCINSDYPRESFRGIFKVAEYGMLFIISSCELRRGECARRTLYVIAVSAAVICLDGIYQYFFGVDLIRGRRLIDLDYLHRISSSFVHPNSFGVYLSVVSMVLAGFVLSRAEKLKNKLKILPAAILSITCLVLTRSRGSWAGFAAALPVWGALRSKKRAVILAVLVIVASAAVVIVLVTGMFNVDEYSGGTVWERMRLWQGTIDMIKVHPVLGFGVNTYSKNFPAYKPADYPNMMYSHNCYLQMASETGIVGVALFILFLVSVFIYSLSGMYGIPPGMKKDVFSGLYAGLVGFSLSSIVDTHLYSLSLAVFFYLLLGLCFSLSFHGKGE